ncbi:hypothetical protein BSKO_01978 [Bryopsis sp. KO-2023]|nr:hypothetical protein BSKO_01978 [Bryopsis sp. KO-2023]
MGAHLSALFGIGHTGEWISRRCDLTGKVAIVTGANSGLGFETARILCKAGAKVYMACRDPELGDSAKKKIVDRLGDGFAENLVVRKMDLSSLETVKTFAEEFMAAEDRLDFLILNAGVMGIPGRKLTAEGLEWHFGVNFFGHFYLTKLLFRFLIERENRVPTRILVVTCSAGKQGKLKLMDLDFRSRKYYPYRAYNQSKLACWLFVQELGIRLKRDFQSEISVFAVDPGACDTQLFRNVSPFALFMMAVTRMMMKNVGKGSATIIHGCINQRISKFSGAYLENCRVTEVQKSRRHACLRQELWAKCENMLESMSFGQPVLGARRTTSVGHKKSRKRRSVGNNASLWDAVQRRLMPAVRFGGNSDEGMELVTNRTKSA